MAQFTSDFSLQPESIQHFLKKLVQSIHPESVILFGSRARGNHRQNSDFDIVCKFSRKDSNSWTRFLVELPDNTSTLWPIDLVDYAELSQDYQTNIDAEGVLLYG